MVSKDKLGFLSEYTKNILEGAITEYAHDARPITVESISFAQQKGNKNLIMGVHLTDKENDVIHLEFSPKVGLYVASRLLNHSQLFVDG